MSSKPVAMPRKMIMCAITKATSENIKFELVKAVREGKPMMWQCPKSAMDENVEAFAFVDQKAGKIRVARVLCILDDFEGGRPHWDSKFKDSKKARVIISPAIREKSLKEWRDITKNGTRFQQVACYDMPSNWYV